MINHAIQTDVRKRCLETPVQKRILQALASLADEKGEIKRSLPEIAMKAQACRRKVIQVLHELADREEILILNTQRVRGHYRINHLPGDDKPSVDSLRTPIADAIRLLPLPVRISVIFQSLAKYASRHGNNIFPSLKTLGRDTGYSKQIIQETLRWLLDTQFIVPDKDCINPKYQVRTGYKIPGWNANAQLMLISDEQIEQIKALYHQRHQHYWLERGLEREGKIIEVNHDESTWLEDHSMDLDEYQPDDPWFEEDQELGEDEPVSEIEKQVSALHYPQGDEEGVAPLFKPEAPAPAKSEMVRAILSPEHRRNTAVSLKSYHAAIDAMQTHLDLIEAHESGRTPVDEPTIQKSLKIVRFYERTLNAYEQQCNQRE